MIPPTLLQYFMLLIHNNQLSRYTHYMYYVHCTLHGVQINRDIEGRFLTVFDFL